MFALYLPENLHENLQNMTNAPNERCGIIIAANVKDSIIGLAALIEGIGTAGEVTQSGAEVAFMYNFADTTSLHEDFKLVPFHTHTIETIRQFGDCYRGNFSESDVKSIRGIYKATNKVVNAHLLLSHKSRPVVAYMEDGLILDGFYGVKKFTEEGIRTGQKLLGEFIFQLGAKRELSFNSIYNL